MSIKLGDHKVIMTILTLALPAVIDNFFQTILGFVDTFFVAKIGLEEVTAVGVANTIIAVYLAILMAVGVSVNVYVAKYLGAGDKEKANKVATQSIQLAIVLGLLLGFISLVFAKPLLTLMGLELAVLDKSVLYFQVVSFPTILISLMLIMSSILRGAKDTKTPMKISIVVNLLNIVLDYILIFGFLFIPSLGLLGAALATVLARLIGVILLSYYLYKPRMIQIKDLIKIDYQLYREMISLSIPAMGERLAMRLGQVLYFGMIVYIGTKIFAAHQIAGNIEIISYMIGYGFATAGTTLVSQSLGANAFDEAQKIGTYCVGLSVGVMSVVGVILFFGGEWLGSLFTTDQEAIKNIGIALRVDAFIQPILAVVLVLTGIYQGAENAKTPFYLTAIGIWVIRTVGVYVLGVYFGLGILGIWLSIGLDNLFRAVFLGKNFMSGKWLQLIKKKSLKAS
ncbi:MATE family efflux transporter [Bacillus carboniphilus]|uniref:Probable multidrug resistance protein NorM n=1 Tax=Bacillus carboniphilus TaxID=86663 RepID=A0ABP3FZ72_9BACI